MKKDRNFNFVMESETYAKLKKISQLESRSLSGMIRRLIELEFERVTNDG